MKREAPLLIILSSPSGAGKTSLARELRARDPKVVFSISATTRPPRSGEIDGEHYYFYDKDVFFDMVQRGEMLEYAEVFGNYYGTPRAPVLESLEKGLDVIFDVDWQGGQAIRQSDLAPYVVSIFVLPPSIHELHQRLLSRDQDAQDVIERRMSQSRAEISHWSEYDYLIVNHDINKASGELRAIIDAERVRRTRWKNVERFIGKLNGEFETLWPLGGRK